LVELEGNAGTVYFFSGVSSRVLIGYKFWGIFACRKVNFPIIMYSLFDLPFPTRVNQKLLTIMSIL
jgi:hypothetical protein